MAQRHTQNTQAYLQLTGVEAAQFPTLVDRQERIAVLLTGTLARAIADLAAIDLQRRPAHHALLAKLKNAKRLDALQAIRTNAAAAASVPALRTQVAELADLINLILRADAERNRLGITDASE
jgi:hypothetical protein